MKTNFEVSEAVEEYLENPSKKALSKFLIRYKKMLQEYLDGKIDELELADTSNYVFAIKKEFFKTLPDKVLELADIVDITHPDWDSKEKKALVLKLQKLIDNLLKDNKKIDLGKKFEKEIMPRLIEVYELYISTGITEQVKQKAKQLHDGLLTSSPLLSEVVSKAVSKLFSIAYNDLDSGIKLLSKEEAKKILEELYKLEKSW